MWLNRLMGAYSQIDMAMAATPQIVCGGFEHSGLNARKSGRPSWKAIFIWSTLSLVIGRLQGCQSQTSRGN